MIVFQALGGVQVEALHVQDAVDEALLVHGGDLAGDAAQNVPCHGQGGHIEGENENVDDVRFIHDQRDRCEDGDDDSQNDRQIAVIGFNCFSGIHLIASSES